jgi:hypothetical protein
MSTIQLPRAFPILGYETNRYFLLDLDKRTSLEEVKKIAFEIGKKYGLGNCLIVHSSGAKQMTLDLKPLQNYNLIYGKKVPFKYQQWVLKQLRDSGILRDIRYVEFREREGTSTLRVSPKSEHKSCGKVVAYVRITGENEGIKEYLKLSWVGRKVEKFLAEEFAHESWEEIALLKLH